jgi:PQQ-dependent dehydrogenase (s-GDH family)
MSNLLKGVLPAAAAVSVCALTATAIPTANAGLGARATAATTEAGGGQHPGFTKRVVATGLGDPYEIVWGPDRHLWVTEKSGLKVTRVNPRTGAKKTALRVRDAIHTAGGQDGVLGLALHPDLLRGKGHDWVYISYTYKVAQPAPVTGETRRTKLVRFTYQRRSHRLTQPRTIIAGLPGGTDHQSARLRIGSTGKLYYTIGDQGANQLAYYCRPNWAQRLPTAREVRTKDWAAYQGKTLRLNPNGSIPATNPRLRGVRSHIWAYGFRNAQGLTFGHHGRLYLGDQGPKTDDEVNLLRRGGNFGWPRVAGYRDDKAYVYANWSASSNPPCEELTYSDLTIPDSVPTSKETDFRRPIIEPMITFYTVDNGFDFTDPKCAESGLFFICWPTVANSSLEFYRARRGDGIPGWENSLLMTTLKDGNVYRLKLTADGGDVASVHRIGRSQNRYRDTALSPNGRRVYVATDNAGLVRGPNGEPSFELENPGSILMFRWHR